MKLLPVCIIIIVPAFVAFLVSLMFCLRENQWERSGCSKSALVATIIFAIATLVLLAIIIWQVHLEKKKKKDV